MTSEITLQPKYKLGSTDVEAIWEELELKITRKGSLKSVAENIHWHYKSETKKGTLEITLLLKSGQVVLAYKENRKGDWIEEAIAKIRKKLID